jgi:magnesium-transporting ATPase (P-type)
MDSFGSLALATEPPYEELLESEPTKRNALIINGHMWKNIILQSIFQFALILFLYLYGPKFIPEDNLIRVAENIIIRYCYGEIPGAEKNEKLIISGVDKDWSSKVNLKPNIEKEYCGSYASRQTLGVAYKEYINNNCSTAHLTIIFNVFVFYSLFNQINCRVLDDSLNIFKRIHKSYIFILVTIIEIIIQILIIFFGNAVFHICFNGLTWQQWLISLGFSAISFIVSIFGKFTTLDRAIDKCLVYEEVDDEEDGGYDDMEKNNKSKKDNFESTSSERSIKVEEPNCYDDTKKKDEPNSLKMSDFTIDSEKKNSIDEN